MSRHAVIGITPAPCTGVTVLRWEAGAALDPEGIATFQAYPYTAEALRTLVGTLAPVTDDTTIVLESYRRAGRASGKTDWRVSRVLDYAAAQMADHSVRINHFGMVYSTVALWATSTRMRAAGLEDRVALLPAARRAANLALYTAVHRHGLSDPLPVWK